MLGLTVLACGTSSERQRYTLTAFESVGVQTDAEGVVIKDARERLPELLNACGIAKFDNLPATDSAVILRFAADTEQVGCVRKSAPQGAELREVAA